MLLNVVRRFILPAQPDNFGQVVTLRLRLTAGFQGWAAALALAYHCMLKILLRVYRCSTYSQGDSGLPELVV